MACLCIDVSGSASGWEEITDVMHCRLPRIVTQDACNHDDFISLREPSFLATKVAFNSMALRLSGRGRKIEPSHISQDTAI